MLDYLKDDPHIVLLSACQATGNISLFHHVQEVSGVIGSNFKAKACVKGWSASAMALQIDERLCSDSILTNCPKKMIYGKLPAVMVSKASSRSQEL